MKILIITTCYPPDTAIAAVRPYMFAKYLKQYGHDVTVLRSGLLQQSADRSFSGHEGIRVITYLGENSMAEQFERGESDFMQYSLQSGDSRISFLPEAIRKPLAKVYHTIISPYDFYQWLVKDYIQGRAEPLKKAVDQMKREGDRFDVVFSTYGAVENIFGGEYAAEVFGAKWFLDFRDPIEPHSPNAFGVPFLKRIQRNAVRKADVCTAVSEDLAKHLSDQAGGKTVHTLYNGYEPNEADIVAAAPAEGILSFCYTGQMYAGKRDFSPVLKALQKLSEEGRISLDKVRVHYAGKDFEVLRQQAEKYHVADILVDHGYLGRKETAQMQAESDIYVVLSWNTRKEKGVLTGKFYEGIRARKPILSIVSGNVPDSELNTLNEKYHYGFCYETALEEETFPALCEFLRRAYQEKMEDGRVKYEPMPELESAFRYDNLAKQMEEFCQQL
ncbi:MAG: hypothetical protein J6J18_04635 [Oscillospiraceae bacterium]|nr:hypothetical protein [Oscillospiraceae bacterium]